MGRKGLPDLDTGERGAENLKVTVGVPDKLSKRQQELLKEFADEEKKSGKGLFGRVL